MKITLSKAQWELIGKNANWMKTAVELPENYQEIREKRFYDLDAKNIPQEIADTEIKKSVTSSPEDVIVARHHALQKHKLLSAISLAIPCLEDWIQKTGFGETYQRDLKALNAMKNAVKEIDPKGFIKDTPFEN